MGHAEDAKRYMENLENEITNGEKIISRMNEKLTFFESDLSLEKTPLIDNAFSIMYQAKDIFLQKGNDKREASGLPIADLFYSDLETIAKSEGCKIHYNNTKTILWFSLIS